MEGRKTTRRTVRRWIFRWQDNRNLKDSHRSGWLSKITNEIADYLEKQLKEDDKLSSVELQCLVNHKFALELSPSTIHRYLCTSLQWVVVRTRFGHMMSDNNKSKEVNFARMCLETNDDFSNVIWTVVSSVQLRRHSQMMRVKVWKERTLKPQAKHTIKAHVWAVISMRGATKICIFDQAINVLREFLLPLTRKQFPGCEYRFMQDNNPRYTGRKARELYEEEGINWWPTPASSADMWRELKFFIVQAFVTIQLESGNRRRRTITWRLNSQPTP